MPPLKGVGFAEASTGIPTRNNSSIIPTYLRSRADCHSDLNIDFRI
jgi:hypothetical protein